MAVDTMLSAKKHERATAIFQFVTRTTMLRESTFAHLDAMLVAIARNKMSFASDIATSDPSLLTEKEATTIGRAFEPMLRSNTMPTAAVDELVLKYASLLAVVVTYTWFRPMLEIIAKRQMARAPLGTKLRVGLGALLSFFNVASSIYNIVSLLQEGHVRTAYGITTTLVLNLAFQLWIVVIQNKHRGWRSLAKQMLITVALLKPAMDALHVASDSDPIAGAPFDRVTEMLVTKGWPSSPSLIPQSLTAKQGQC
jgi:hypothetical protein